MPRLRHASFVVLLAITAGACGGTGSTATAGDVSVTLKDFSLTVDPQAFAAGDITFGITNEGPSAHEFVILRTDDEPDALPVENGLIPEDQVDLVDEVEDIAPGTNTTLTANLTAGSYVLVCNLPSHYAAGMYTGFTVS
jgi:uncharacterized cupredoxin-like copper-binding protein